MNTIRTGKTSILPSSSKPVFSSISIFFSTWYSPPSSSPFPNHEEDPILTTISQAIQNSQTKPFESSLKKHLHSITDTHVINLINRNPNSLSPTSLLSFFNFLSSQPKFRLTIQSYCTMAHFLASHKLHPQAKSLVEFVVSRKGKESASSVLGSVIETRGNHQSNFLFDALMIAYTDLGFIPDAIQCFRVLRKHNFRIPVQGCSYLIRYVMKANPPMVVWGFFMEILDSGYSPNVYQFNVLMHRFCKESKIKNAQMVFDEMGKRGLRPTLVSFNTLINGYCKSGNLEEGFRLKGVMEKIKIKINPDVFTYSSLINGLCRENKLEEADKLFDEMSQKGLIPNDVIFTTLIDGQCKNGRTDSAMEVYNKMLTKGLKPDLIMYNTLINGLCKNGDLNEARKLVNEMNSKGLKPDKITYTTLIDGFCKELDLESALEIRDEMVHKGKIELDDVAFTAIISGMCRLGKVVEAEKTLREMLEAGMKPDDAVYTMIIDGFCKKGDVKIGLKLVKEMQIDGRVPCVVTYNVILNGLSKQGQMKNADVVLDAMLNLGVVPDDITYNIMLEGHCRKHGNSVGFDTLRSELGVVADFGSYKSLVGKLSRNSKDKQNR